LRTVRSIALAVLLCALPALAELPASFPLPPKTTARNDNFLNWSEASFPLTEKEDDNVQRGKLWSFELSTTAVAEDKAGAEIWASLKPHLLKAGWSVAKEWALTPHSVVLKKGNNLWAVLTLSSVTEIVVTVVESGPQPLAFSLKPPGAKPETLGEADDFPYLTPLPKSEKRGGTDDATLPLVVPTGPETIEVVGSGSRTRSYGMPDGHLSPLQFAVVYSEALKKAGWTVVHETHGLHQTDATLAARYQKNGRSLWASLHGAGEDYSFTVADLGADDLASKLAKDCRVPLYGVLFDFNKSSLKPESDAVLTKARDALKANPQLKVEVQGHTDNVGGDAYNQKLSGERAAAVLAWLTKNGIPAAQLSSKGYGKSQPVESNESPEGRAKNRRVELSCRK
jgi:OmpA-OmpF porin, OOP family